MAILRTQSGLRALLIYPEFPPSYWTLDFVLNLSGRKTLAPPLGLVTVAALLPQEWRLRLVDENVQSLAVAEADWEWAEVVLLSAMIAQHKRLKELIREAKARGKTVAVGGPYPSVAPEDMLAWGADLVLKGELENQVGPFLAALEAGPHGVVLEAPAKPDLSASPVPRFDLLRLQDYLMLSLQTSRGCPFDCEFCDVVRIFGRRMRHKTPEQVMAEMAALHRLGWRGEIFVSDDNFIGDKSYARDLLERMIPWQKSHGEPFDFTTQASVNLGQEPELIDLMTAANFASVIIGIESPDEEVLRATHKHHNLRHSLVDSVNAVSANGLSVIGSFIIGFDNERPGAGERIAAFVEATNLPQVTMHLLFPFPRTRLWERLKQENRLREERWREDMEGGGFLLGRLPYRPVRAETEILSEYLGLWERLYDPAHFLGRTYRYYLAMRPTRATLAQARGEAPPAPTADGFLTFRERLASVRQLLRLSWELGVKSPSRRQFWSQLISLQRRNPSRVYPYLKTCAMGKDFFHLRDVVRRQLTAYLEEARRAGR